MAGEPMSGADRTARDELHELAARANALPDGEEYEEMMEAARVLVDHFPGLQSEAEAMGIYGGGPA